MQTGVGATACASASQKWNGTAAALTRRPVTTRTNASRHQGVLAAGVRVETRRRSAAKPSSPGARVQQADAQQRGVGAERVDDAEVQGALDGAGLLDAVAGQRVGDDAHQLEEDERVEQVAGQHEAAHARLEQQHQRGKRAGVAHRRFVEVPPGVARRRPRPAARSSGGHAESDAVADQHDADARAVVRAPAAQPCDGPSAGPAAPLSAISAVATVPPANRRPRGISAATRGRPPPAPTSSAAPSSGIATISGRSPATLTRPQLATARRGRPCRAAWRPGWPGRAAAR